MKVAFNNYTKEDLICQVRLSTNSRNGEYTMMERPLSAATSNPNCITMDVPLLKRSAWTHINLGCAKHPNELLHDSEEQEHPFSKVRGTVFSICSLLAHKSSGPWRVIKSKTDHDDHYTLSIFPKRDLSAFLSSIPDFVPLSSLCLPGTHESIALHGWPFAQCQSTSTPLATQLRSGIRVLDVRLSNINGKLIAYHDIIPQRTPFTEILETIRVFLKSPKSSQETLIMSIKQEDFRKTSVATFSKLIREEITNSKGGLDMWFFENRIPTLGEVRGKVIMFSRFEDDGRWKGGLEGMGIHPTTWPDSRKEGFEWNCKNTLVRTHDWYHIPSFLSIPEKAKLATRNLIVPSGKEEPPMPLLNISYFSAASIPLALPPVVANGFGWPPLFGFDGVNAQATKWLLNILGGSLEKVYLGEFASGEVTECSLKTLKSSTQGTRVQGWALMDFYTADLVTLLVECNFHGRESCEGRP